MRTHRAQLVAFAAVVCCMLSALAAAMQQTVGARISEQQLQEAYAQHFAKVRESLPPHSALPPLLDLTKPQKNENAKDRAWEKPYTLSIPDGGAHDLGVPNLSEATSTSRTFFDNVGRPLALPARSCEAVIVGEPVGGQTRISSNRQLVYSRLSVKVLSVWKRGRKSDIHDGAEIIAVQLGGSVLYPSGHLTTFVVVHQGFMGPGKKYVLFLWRPPKSSQTYMTAESYLVQDGLVFPVNTEADVSAYDGMPLDKFEVEVRDAIRQNIDAN